MSEVASSLRPTIFECQHVGGRYPRSDLQESTKWPRTCRRSQARSDLQSLSANMSEVASSLRPTIFECHHVGGRYPRSDLQFFDGSNYQNTYQLVCIYIPLAYRA